MKLHQIIVLCTWALPAWAGITVPEHEKQCDGVSWACRIVCSQGMLGGRGQKANWCVAKHCTRQKAVAAAMVAASQEYCSKKTCFIQETEAMGLLQFRKPQQGSLVAMQVNATTDCLDEKAVCGKFCDALNSPRDFCMPKCTEKAHAIADALDAYCDKCASPSDDPTTTEKEYKTTTEEPTTTEEATTTTEEPTTTTEEPTTTTEEPTTTTEEPTTTTEEPTTTTEEPTTTEKEYKTTTKPPVDDDMDGRRRRKDDDKDRQPSPVQHSHEILFDACHVIESLSRSRGIGMNSS